MAQQKKMTRRQMKAMQLSRMTPERRFQSAAMSRAMKLQRGQKSKALKQFIIEIASFVIYGIKH